MSRIGDTQQQYEGKPVRQSFVHNLSKLIDKLYLQLKHTKSLYRIPENLAALELRFIGKVKTKSQAFRSNPGPTAQTKPAPSLGQA